MIESYGLSDIGCVRTENQDRVLTDHSLSVFVVADGMGGHRHGEMAAELAISTIRYYIEMSSDRLDATWPFGYDIELSADANRLSTAIQIANRQIWGHAQQAPECEGMGTTVAAILLSDGVAIVGNVGDSRVYLYRANELRQISLDDSFVSALAQQDGVELEEMSNHPMRNMLTQAAGVQSEPLKVHIVEQSLQSGDLYLICSDGLHGVIGNAAIRSVLGAGETLERTAVHLKESACGRGGPDNISVVLLSYDL